MNRTNAPCCPCRPFSGEDSTLTADIATFKKWLLTIDRSDDIQHADRPGRTSEPKASPRALSGDHQTRFLQLREQLCYVFSRHALELSKSPNARRTTLVERFHQIKQAMQPVLHA